MSTILRALKKLENEPRHHEESQGLDSKFVPLADTRPQKKSATPLVMVIGGGIVCGLVILAGWLLFFEKPQPVTTQQVTEQIQPQPQTASSPGGNSSARQETAIVAGPKISAAPEKVPETPVAPLKPEGLTAQATSVTLPHPSSPSIGQKELLDIAEQQSPAAGPESGSLLTKAIDLAGPPEVAGTGTEASAMPEKEPEKIKIPLLQDAEIKLQAITWSRDPEKRIAVINNSILRQGEAVAGYRIDVINQDDVVLSNRESKWKLQFRIR